MAQRRDQPFHELFREGVKFTSIYRRSPRWTECGGRRFFAGQPAPPPLFVQAGAAQFAYIDGLHCHLNTAFMCEENTLISGIIWVFGNCCGMPQYIGVIESQNHPKEHPVTIP